MSTQFDQIQKAIEAIEAQRNVMGDFAADMAIQALKKELDSLKATDTTKLSGERRQATILFSDLSGYTAMNEILDPEEVLDIMQNTKAESIKIIEKNGGTVNQFVGDEVLALFGIPVAHVDDPSRAAISALQLHAYVRSISGPIEKSINRELRLHSGINSGLVVTTSWDSREGKIGITGDTINTAARLLNSAKPDQILVSNLTAQLLDKKFDLNALEPIER